MMHHQNQIIIIYKMNMNSVLLNKSTPLQYDSDGTPFGLDLRSVCPSMHPSLGK